MAHWKNLKGSRPMVGATEAKAEGKAARKAAAAAAIAEGLADAEPSAEEAAFEADAAFEAVWYGPGAEPPIGTAPCTSCGRPVPFGNVTDEGHCDDCAEGTCGDCGGPCYYWEVKGEPCSMFVEVVRPDGTHAGPADWEF